MSTQTNGLSSTLKTMGMTEAELEALTAPKSGPGVTPNGNSTPGANTPTPNGNGTAGQGNGQGQYKGGVRVDVGTGKAEPESPEQELARLRSENAALRAKRSGGSGTITLHVSEKGALSAYGLGRFPVTLYAEQWVKLLGQSKAILEFVTAHTVTPEVRTVDGVSVSRLLVTKPQ